MSEGVAGARLASVRLLGRGIMEQWRTGGFGGVAIGVTTERQGREEKSKTVAIG